MCFKKKKNIFVSIHSDMDMLKSFFFFFFGEKVKKYSYLKTCVLLPMRKWFPLVVDNIVASP